LILERVGAAGAEMMSDQANQAKSIFLAAIDGHTAQQWPAFLDEACAGDVQLRAQVEKLLRAQAALGSFHETRRLGLAPTGDERIRECPGALIGPYKVLEQIGEGGFGVVFLAEQQQSIRRLVALKLLKHGMDTRQVLARFEAERQALALMDHPNIARVLDAGETPPACAGGSPRPYFVMELVKGMPITQFCDHHHLAPEARLKLFIDVCHAIQHAHHKGVIHRDIKPGNVLVTLHDGVPVVKVIDFGVARAMGQKLTERTLFTTRGQMVGTPAYMSPEQAEMSGLDIDTRSDVYSLGVLLYELLTGTTPLEISRLQDVGYAEMQRLIREEEAPRPSTRLSSLGDSATVLASNRGLDVKRLRQLLAGELDWVVMKALEKDRNRRYDTPASFAEDVERYLRREAILARPPSLAYKLKKFTQRNRVAVLTVAAVAAALLAGTAVASWQAVCARQAEAGAVAAARAERLAKEDAQAREAELEAVLKFVEERLFALARPEGLAGGVGRDVRLREAALSALSFVEKDFKREPLIEARLRLTLGMSFAYLGKNRTAAAQFEAARALNARHRGPYHRETLASMHNLARIYHALSRFADARKLYEETLAVQRATLGPDHPETLLSGYSLAITYAALGRHSEALQLREQTLARRKARLGPDHADTLRSILGLANSYEALGRHADALRLREQTLPRMKARLGRGHPDTLLSMYNLASSYEALGRHADALRLREQTLALQEARLGPDHPDTFASRIAVAASCAALGRHADAMKMYTETLALQQLKLGPDHRDTLLTAYNLALTYTALGRHTDALELHEQTLAGQQGKLGPDHPDTLRSMWAMAASLIALDRGAEAVAVIDECFDLAAGKVGCPPDLLPGMMGLRLRYFAKRKDAAGCRQTATMWETLKRSDTSSLYYAACMRAVTAAVLRAAGKQADAEADRAMAWLKQAIAAGYKNAARLKRDRNLDALRNREDFTKLVTVLEGRRD
jgi:serine/threonine protein kinase/tetratricopeptide (TPR) repeat protein